MAERVFWRTNDFQNKYLLKSNKTEKNSTPLKTKWKYERKYKRPFHNDFCKHNTTVEAFLMVALSFNQCLQLCTEESLDTFHVSSLQS